MVEPSEKKAVFEKKQEVLQNNFKQNN